VTRLLMLVEGQTEETFAKRTLAPWLAERGVYASPTLLWTKRLPTGGGFRGGVSSWAQIRKSLDPLLADGDAWVTTLLDLYGLPDDVPGVATALGLGDPVARVEAVQTAMAQALPAAPRFVPFLALHEFEAWLYAGPSTVAAHFGQPALDATLAAEVQACGGPEAINQGTDTHPKARLERLQPGYKAAADGPTILHKIGIEAIRASCPHFSRWLDRLASLGTAG
jgi:hypothetical protein